MAKKQFSRIGLAAAVMLVSGSVLQVAAALVAALIWHDGEEPGWVMWACTFVPMYMMAMPLGLLIMRKVPAEQRERRRMKFGAFLVTGLICVFMMYAGNLLGNIILFLIQAVAGSTAENPLLNYTSDDNVLLRALVMVVIAPVIEEYIFRKQLIDRMSVYGEELAVFTSALMFGLFHGNLSQFFYAFALGLAFGFIYLKTGLLRYSTALHMFINFLGGVIAPALLNSINLDALDTIDITDMDAVMDLAASLLPFIGYALVMMLLTVAGLVLFCVNFRKVDFQPAPMELPRGERFKTAYLNVGMCLFVLLSLASIVLTFVI